MSQAPTSSPYGFQRLKSGSPPILPTRPMISATVAVTTLANAVPMTKATASSMRLPRRMKFLNPDMLCSFCVYDRRVLGDRRSR